MLAAGLTGLAKIEEYARGAVDALACRKRSADQTKEPSVFLRSPGKGFAYPCIVATTSHTKHTAHHLYAVSVTVFLDEFIDLTNTAGLLSRGHSTFLSQDSIDDILNVLYILGSPA
jgi:hypothetical protein